VEKHDWGRTHVRSIWLKGGRKIRKEEERGSSRKKSSRGEKKNYIKKSKKSKKKREKSTPTGGILFPELNLETF